jgi:hypothetical protein
MNEKAISGFRGIWAASMGKGTVAGMVAGLSYSRDQARKAGSQ